VPRFRLLLAAALILTGCSSDATAPRACVDDLETVTVSAGTEPRFSWTPSCATQSLRVFRVSDSQTVWSIRAPRTTLRSGIRYGDEPNGVTTSVEPVALVAGTQYRVSLSNDGIFIHGAASFTP
jgi:hypothetical protein